MFCSKCGNELEDGSIFCDKCGKKVKSNNGDKKGNKLPIIIILIVVVIATVVVGFIIMNNKDKINNPKQSNISSNKELIRVDDNALGGATYNFTLEDVKKSMDKTCKEKGINTYLDFEYSYASEAQSVYCSYKDETKEYGCWIFVTTYNEYVSEIKFNYYDEIQDNITAGEIDVFYNILKDNYEENYSNEIKSIFEALPNDKYEYYNNTLCYKTRFDNYSTTEYSIMASSEDNYKDMEARYPNMFDETNTSSKVSSNTIDREGFLKNLNEDGKESIRKYVQNEFEKLQDDPNFIEDRFEVIGSELVYIYINVDIKNAYGQNVFSNLQIYYCLLTPLTDIPENWKELSYADLSNYLKIGILNWKESTRFPAGAISDEEISNAMAESKPIIEEILNYYRDILNLPLTKDNLKHLADGYVDYIYNFTEPQTLKDEGFKKIDLKKAKDNITWTSDTIADSPYYYCRILGNNKVLLIKYYRKSILAQNYRENNYYEFTAIGVLIDVNSENVPILYKKSMIRDEYYAGGKDFIEPMIKLNYMPEISSSTYVIAPTKKILSTENTEYLADEFINYVCTYFGV